MSPTNHRSDAPETMPAIVASTCDQCSAPVDLVIGASGYTGTLRSWASYRCAACGACTEADSTGPLDPEERQMLLATEGERGLRVDEDGERALQATQRLRALLELPMQQAMAMRKAMPGVVFRGVAAECEWLCAELKQAGLRASVVSP